MRYRKKPLVIEADQWFPEKLVPEVCLCDAALKAHIHTLEGPQTISPGDWILTGVKGEKYPCKADIFEATYEPVEQERPE